MLSHMILLFLDTPMIGHAVISGPDSVHGTVRGLILVALLQLCFYR